ncbi:unannotated protein [freshwater metagenome]|uniref:Unannotated protein n=1 Tax=freshwater metagenome TaxID=449393 RepID=A0A6J7KTQ5_9ZZZZ|nr:hypothetical protein [Actinomycetota bacterium]
MRDDEHMATPGTYRVSDNRAVEFDDALYEWAKSARLLLIEVASTYNSHITYGVLAEQVQAETGIRTRSLITHWIGSVLGLVAEVCGTKGEPLLTSLCTQKSGAMGMGYGIGVTYARGGNPPDNPDAHAAAERLACYREFASDMPSDGGAERILGITRVKAPRAPKPAPPQRPICPRCFLQTPASGRCDQCD